MQNDILFILKGMGLTVNLYVLTLVFSLPLGIILSLGRLKNKGLVNNNGSEF